MLFALLNIFKAHRFTIPLFIQDQKNIITLMYLETQSPQKVFKVCYFLFKVCLIDKHLFHHLEIFQGCFFPKVLIFVVLGNLLSVVYI